MSKLVFSMRFLIPLTLFAPAAWPQAANSRPFRIEELRTPPGFEVSVYATVPGGPRHMAFGPNGALYVAARNNGGVVAVPSQGRVVTAVRGLSGPHSLVFRDSVLFVSVNDRVIRLPDAVTESLVISSTPQRVLTVPAAGPGGHATRTVAFGPEGKIYVAIGSSCNFCIEADSRRASILQFDADGSNQQPFASGLRNAVGLAFHPLTREMWATDNGGDGLGDNEPPEEVNIVKAGGDYGWPDCVANQRGTRWGNQARPERCGSTLAPEVEMQAHSAPLGISFYSGDQFPVSFWNDALVAFHGSWNRTLPTGYKVVRVRTADGRATGVTEDLLWGFLDPVTRTRSGRPVQAITGPDGAVYVSDDATGNIYRIEHKGPRINQGGIVRVIDNVYSLYGLRLAGDIARFQIFGNGIALETLYIGEHQVNFVLPETLTGDVTITVRNEITSDEARIRVE